MTAREPDRLPRGVESWEEWREFYADYRKEFVTEKIDRTRYRAYLSLLGLGAEEIEADLAEAFEARRQWRKQEN